MANLSNIITPTNVLTKVKLLEEREKFLKGAK